MRLIDVEPYEDCFIVANREDDFGIKISDIPTVEPKRGEWVGEYDGYADGYPVYDHWYCSVCGWDDGGDLEEKPTYNFCPNCGARMEEADEQTD